MLNCQSEIIMNISTRRKFLKSVPVASLLLPLKNYANNLKINNREYEIRQPESGQKEDYLSEMKAELIKEWPNNRTINLVFHGHSVPSGYFKTPDVNTLAAYPHLLLAKLKELYPHAVINSITTSAGGENSQQGAKRFNQVLNHQPDVVFIDYALNDRGIGLESARKAWRRMIRRALKKNIKLILLTPSPDLNEDILSTTSVLKKYSDQIKELAKEFKTGLGDSYQAFREIASHGEDLSDYMAQFNHPNQNGHQVIADRLFRYFSCVKN